MSEPAFKLSRPPNAPISDEELIADLRRVSELLATDKVTQDQYNSHGEYHCTTQERRFGSWNEALLRSGLAISNRMNISDEVLFENVLNTWQHYGRQPRRSELASDPSHISEGPYKRRFGSWMKALKAFVDYANGTGAELAIEETVEASDGNRHLTGRDPSLRLRWHVLQRDCFKCRACGSSPAITLGVELHVDHIHPWSEGGETVLENLQTLCSSCNLGKSNVLPA
jgi:hypothetical protein